MLIMNKFTELIDNNNFAAKMLYQKIIKIEKNTPYFSYLKNNRFKLENIIENIENVIPNFVYDCTNDIKKMINKTF